MVQFHLTINKIRWYSQSIKIVKVTACRYSHSLSLLGLMIVACPDPCEGNLTEHKIQSNKKQYPLDVLRIVNLFKVFFHQCTYAGDNILEMKVLGFLDVRNQPIVRLPPPSDGVNIPFFCVIAAAKSTNSYSQA